MSLHLLILTTACTMGVTSADSTLQGLMDTPALTCAMNQAEATAPLNLALQSDQGAAEEPSIEPHARIAHFGAEGTRRWSIHGGWGAASSDDHLGLLGVGFSHFIADGLSLDLELNGMYFNQEIEDTAGINGNLMLRWHFHRQRAWSVYLDGGCGVLISVNDVPAHGSSFNFMPQAGVGFTFDLGNDARLMTGVRWHHVSNANIYDMNPGRDSVVVYAGVSFPF